MKLLRITTTTSASTIVSWAGSVPNAKTAVREMEKWRWPDTVVEEVNVQTDKAGVVAALNGDPMVTEASRTWGVTSRGALKEE